MKERPIIFTGESVRAILDSRKMQTRRIIKPQFQADRVSWGCVGGKGFGFLFDGEPDQFVKCPYGEPGDFLYVKETWWQHIHDYAEKTQTHPIHFADDQPNAAAGWVKMSPLFLPRSLSRITLEITAICVQRLQDMTGNDVLYEGLPGPFATNGTALIAFAQLWDKINGKKHPWASNPWVWVIEFQKVGPADQVVI